MSFKGDGNSPEYHKFVIRKCIELLKYLRIEDISGRWNSSMEAVKNLITKLAETEMYLLDTEMKKIRRVIVTGDGFEVKKGIFRDRVIGLK